MVRSSQRMVPVDEKDRIGDALAIGRKYPKPPISEASIEIRVTTGPEIDEAFLKNLYSEIRNDYSRQVVVSDFEAQFSKASGESEATASATQKFAGFASISETKHQIVVAAPERFAFTRQAPYGSWEDFSSEARELWHVYRSKTAPLNITRVGTRYINRINIPYPSIDIGSYFRTFPEISSAMPQHLDRYFMQLQMPQQDIACTVLLNQALLPTVAEGVVSMLLDIDVFEESESFTPEQAWNRLEEFRHKKNQIFESCITDRTRELFE